MPPFFLFNTDNIYNMITKRELLMDRDKSFPKEYTSEVSNNLDKLLVAINIVRAAYGKPMRVTSGWRPAGVNSIIGGANRSNHMLGLAVDIADPNGELAKWLLNNLDVVSKAGLYLEDFRWTKGWVHFQIVAPKSGKRIFIPSTAPATQPNVWDGKYDPAFDK
jgi:hypothetical protein